MKKIERAVISVTDKTGVVDFARSLSAFGVPRAADDIIEVTAAGLPVRYRRDDRFVRFEREVNVGEGQELVLYCVDSTGETPA